MKTTIELPDDLLREAKAVAAAEGTTLRSMIVEGLRSVLSGRRCLPEPFTLRDAGVSGRGVQDGLKEDNWAEISKMIDREREA